MSFFRKKGNGDGSEGFAGSGYLLDYFGTGFVFGFNHFNDSLDLTFDSFKLKELFLIGHREY